MDESDVEMDTVFDDNIKIKKTFLQDKTNIENKSIKKSKNKEIIFSINKENAMNSQDILKKYKISFDYEKDKKTNDLYKKWTEDISDKLYISTDVNKEPYNNFMNKLNKDANRKNVLKEILENNNEEYYNKDTNKKNIFRETLKDNKKNSLIQEDTKYYNKDTNRKNIFKETLKDNNKEYYNVINNKDTNRNYVSNEILKNNKESSLIEEDTEYYNVINKQTFNKHLEVNDMPYKTIKNDKLNNIYTGDDIDNASNTIIYEIQKEFNELKESHKVMLQIRNKLLVLIEKEVQFIKKEITDNKNIEILELENKYKTELEKLKCERDYHKERFNKYKIFCKNKVLEYKKKVDDFYRTGR